MCFKRVLTVALGLAILTVGSAFAERLITLWELKHYQDGQELRDICPAGSGGDKAWAVGRDGLVLRTTDDGTTWAPVIVNDNYHFNGVFFTDAQTGCIVGEKKSSPRFQGAIFYTTNGGTSWNQYIPQLERAIPFNDVAVCLGDPDHVYVACGDGVVLYSKGGMGSTNWIHCQPVGVSYLPHVHWFWGVSVDPDDGDKVWVAGDGGPETGIVCKSTDGGTSWVAYTPEESLELNFLDVTADRYEFDSPRIAASEGYQVESTNGGGSWSAYHYKPNQQWFYGAGGGSGFYEFCYATVGSEGLVVNTGYEESYDRRYVLYGVSALLPDYVPYVWATGTKGAILRYQRRDDPMVTSCSAEDGGTYVHLSWDCDYPQIGDWFVIYHSHQDAGGPYHEIGRVRAEDNQYSYEFNDASVKAKIPYCYKMVFAGWEYVFCPQCVTPSGKPDPVYPPVQPHSLTANDTPSDQGGSVTVTWQHGLDVSYSYLYRDGEWFGNAGSPEDDECACTGQNYSYYARNYRYDLPSPGTGELILSDPSNSDDGTAVDNLVPSVPTGLTGIYDADRQLVRLEWNKNPEMDACGYDIFWSFSGSGPWYKTNKPPVPRVAYNDPREQKYSDYYVYYKIRAVDHSVNQSGYTDWIQVIVPAKVAPPKACGGQSVGGERALVPRAYSLRGCSPNPFVSETHIRYQLPATSEVSLSIYSTRGELVKTLVEETQALGHYSVSWDGTDASGEYVSAGLYLLRLRTGNHTFTTRVILLR